MDVEAMEQAVADFLRATGLPDEEYLKDTPARVAKAWVEELLSGYALDPAEALGELLPAPKGDPALVVLTDIPFHSMCAHHLLPFRGVAAVGYLPSVGGDIAGLGGLARLVEVFARRLQTQERLTGQIARALQKALDPEGAAIAIWADHACMQARGPRSPATTVTSKFTGVFASSQGMREEFWEQARSRADNLIGSSTDSRVEA